MKTLLLLILAVISVGCSHAQTLSPTRAVDWTVAGHVGSFMEPALEIDFQAMGGISDGVTPNDSLIEAIISAHSGDSLILYFPDGTWYFTETINLSSNIILRGESIDSTRLLFDLGGAGHLIFASGSSSGILANLIADGIKEDTFIVLDDAAPFAVSDHFYLVDNDSVLVSSSWATKSTGQIIQISGISGDTLFFDNPLRRDFLVAKTPYLKKFTLDENVGIETMILERVDSTVAQTHNVFFNYARNCWVKCVESINCNYSHVNARWCTNIEVSGSYFHHAFDYGGGGKGYGVVFQFATGEGLVTGNSFEHLRHSMLLSQGANGNVFSYNYSIDPFWEDAIFPANSAGDLVLHGDFPYCNLFEGNTVQHIVIDDSHGPNGMFNTFFRNRAELYGFFMNWDEPTNDQNIIGNELPNTGFLLGLYTISGVGHFEHGNNRQGSVHPLGTGTIPEASLYLPGAPSWYVSNSNWPPIGFPNPIDTYHIQAQESYDAGYPSICNDLFITRTEEGIEIEDEVTLFPNPASDWISFSSEINLQEVQIVTLDGKVLLTTLNPGIGLNIESLASGVYIVRGKTSDRILNKRLFVR